MRCSMYGSRWRRSGASRASSSATRRWWCCSTAIRAPMTPSEFQQLVLRLSAEPDNPRRLARFAAQWELLSAELRQNLLLFTDALFASWAEHELAQGLAAFLARLETMSAAGTAEWQLQPGEVGGLRRGWVSVAAWGLLIALASGGGLGAPPA